MEQRLKEKIQEIQQLHEDFNNYRKEKSINERMVNESLEKAREELRMVSMSKSELVAKFELAEERFKVLKGNADSYKAQIKALEKKNSIYSMTIAKHEQSLTHLKDVSKNTLFMLKIKTGFKKNENHFRTKISLIKF